MWRIVLLLCLPLAAWAEDFTQGAAQGPVYVYQTQEFGFDEVRENLKLAIQMRGLIISGTLYVQDVLQRTGMDLGYTEDVYTQAESLEFCSALLSHKMTQLDPLNMVVCPFTVSYFVKPDAPDTVYVAFRKILLAGAAEELTARLEDFLHDLVREALELE